MRSEIKKIIISPEGLSSGLILLGEASAVVGKNTAEIRYEYKVNIFSQKL